MKGLVFTTFYDFVERYHGADVLDDIIEDAGVPHDGAYTSVGTYPFDQMVALTASAAKLLHMRADCLLEAFGEHCFSVWVPRVREHFDGRDLFSVLSSIDVFHEQEVRKLHADAELPSFQLESIDAHRLVLRYVSCKPLADLATGVIRGAARYLGDPVHIAHHPAVGPDGPCMRFVIDRQFAA